MAMGTRILAARQKRSRFNTPVVFFSRSTHVGLRLWQVRRRRKGDKSTAGGACVAWNCSCWCGLLLPRPKAEAKYKTQNTHMARSRMTGHVVAAAACSMNSRIDSSYFVVRAQVGVEKPAYHAVVIYQPHLPQSSLEGDKEHEEHGLEWY